MVNDSDNIMRIEGEPIPSPDTITPEPSAEDSGMHLLEEFGTGKIWMVQPDGERIVVRLSNWD